MAKLPRVTAKVFASNADAADIGQYGSALNGTKVLTSDIEQIQALPAYETGWRGAVISSRNYPTLQEMNGLQKSFSQQIAYLLESGIAEWDSGTNYYKNQFCRVEEVVYYSLTDNNLNNDPTSTDGYWRIYSDVNPYLFLGGILEAPNGIVTYTTTSITAKAGLKFACPNGRDANEVPINSVFTIENDLIQSTSQFGPVNLLWLQSFDNGSTWSFGGRNSSQWYVQATQPTLDHGDATNATWYNPNTNLVKTTSDGGNPWSDILICPVCLTKNDITQTDHPLTEVRPFHQPKFLSLNDTILTQLDKPDSSHKTSLLFNTNYYMQDDGFIYVETEIYAPAGNTIKVEAKVNGNTVYASGASGHLDNTTIASGYFKVCAGDLFIIQKTVQTGIGEVIHYSGYYVPVKREWI